MRLRQIALVAEDLETTVADLCAVLGVEVGFNDPGIAYFGLENAVMPVGDTFLEVVSPVKADTAAGRYRQRKGGDCGYMLLLQTGDFDADRKRMDGLGVRTVWEAGDDEIRAMHLHPRDTGGTLCSVDQPTPPASWKWGGPDWPSKVRTDVSRSLTAAVLAAPDPARLARRFGEVFAQPVRDCGGGRHEIRLDPGTIRFVPARDERGEVLAGFEVASAAPERVLEAARSRGLEVIDGAAKICGTWIRPV
jgi:hypothetical protein